MTLAAVLTAIAPAAAQVGFDRPGGDYANFPVRSGDPASCAARCDGDPRCRAWSFSYPTAPSGTAICWLKSLVVPWRSNSCCVSGVRGAGVIPPRAPGVEFAIDRRGGDYRNFEISPDPLGRSCALACQAEARCRDWTYVRPGYGTSAAHCYLKNHVTPPRRAPCCISGVVR